ncbi:hypothetical protein AVEN_77806-1 [Araneus ventricosus]|uniref:Acyltransferase 3 domain-containing protein n=1 Tax=Araneus ventricosus TaxID=182803 RepID=A0A4Y2TMD1_ARAVE|nr:hypothetical protein AVEN_77806-1 [Araneus ventricosus]
MLSLGWIMAAIFMWISLFALYGREESVLETAVYNGLKHLLFSISVAWIIFVCVTGQGGFFNRFLSSKIFIVISRLSYTIYLTHMVILEGYFLAMKDLIDHSTGAWGGVLTLILFNLKMIFWILSASFVVSLVFEAPILRITALFFRETKQEIKTSKQE